MQSRSHTRPGTLACSHGTFDGAQEEGGCSGEEVRCKSDGLLGRRDSHVQLAWRLPLTCVAPPANSRYICPGHGYATNPQFVPVFLGRRVPPHSPEAKRILHPTPCTIFPSHFIPCPAYNLLPTKLPPSSATVAPFTYAPALDANQTHVPAISSALPILPRGILPSISAWNFSSVAFIILL